MQLPPIATGNMLHRSAESAAESRLSAIDFPPARIAAHALAMS